MKPILIPLLLAAAAASAIAQETIAAEHLAKIVPRLVERAREEPHTPFTTEVDAASAFGMKVKGYGAIVLPSRTLTKDALAKVDASVMPIGQLWLARLVPMTHGTRIAADQLRPILLTVEENERTLQLLYLGLRKKAGGDLELLIFGIGKEPIATLSLKKTQGSQDTPLEFELRKGTESLGALDLWILGEYEASLALDEGQP